MMQEQRREQRSFLKYIPMNENTISAVIVDDSPQARKLLRLMLAEWAPDVEVTGEAEDLESAVTLIRSVRPDLVFLDIEMPGKSGLQLVEELSREDVPYEIIFTTAYNDHALKAFRLSALDYLLKPIDEKLLVEAVSRMQTKKDLLRAGTRLEALSRNLEGKSNVICIPVYNGYEYIPVKDIECLEADGSYVHIYMNGQKQKTISRNLKYFENALRGISNFVRVHRSFIVNTDYIASVSKSDGGTVILTNGMKAEIARGRRNEVFSLLGKA